MHKLMVKTHKKTGLKYLCYTQKEGVEFDNYKGSGKLWKKHLKEFGDEILTEIIFQSENYELFKQIATQKSLEFNVIESEEWLNLKLEEGDGGDTVSNKIWITNGIKDKYHNKNENIPDGWIKGRSNCIFKDVKKQSEFGKRIPSDRRSLLRRKDWVEGKYSKRDNSKCGIKGNNNPAKRSEVKEKIRKWALENGNRNKRS